MTRQNSRADQACKSCRSDYAVTQAQIDRLLALPMFDSANCVPEDEYQRRLDSCHTCERLHEGITCTVCGCIIPVMAKLKARQCGLPKGQRRWERWDESDIKIKMTT